jgi:pimeloyl-ACP methyl ester carboxylesterase
MLQQNLTVVLVHGAWADGSSWRDVITPLRGAGLDVVAAPLPLTSLEDDVAALERTLERLSGPVVLVGHAYAGAVIGEARSDQVRALVYVAALAPDEGEAVADVFHRDEPDPRAPRLAPDAHGLIWLPREAFASAFAQNASEADREWLAAVQRPIAVTCIGTPVGRRPRWKDLPSWYLLAEDDRMIRRQTQAFMAERMKARVVSHAVDHTPGVTAPQLVVDVIVAAASSIASASQGDARA